MNKNEPEMKFVFTLETNKLFVFTRLSHSEEAQSFLQRFYFSFQFFLCRPPRHETGLESSFVTFVGVRVRRESHARAELQVPDEGSDVNVVLDDSPSVRSLIT
jgi:hypothetical protein